MSAPEPDPLDLFFRQAVLRAGGLFGSRPAQIGKKEALLCLGLLVEVGRKRCIEVMRHQGISGKNIESVVEYLLAQTGETVLFTDESFAFSLRLAFYHAAIEAINQPAGEDKPLEELLAHQINGIFPERLHDRILGHIYTNVIKDYGDDSLRKNVPSQTEIKKHLEERRIAFREALKETAPKIPTPPVIKHGTDTWMEPCPSCGVEKRCDKRTRRFHCKPCGFDQPYPFKPAS